jgi:hypothetical protein
MTSTLCLLIVARTFRRGVEVRSRRVQESRGVFDPGENRGHRVREAVASNRYGLIDPAAGINRSSRLRCDQPSQPLISVTRAPSSTRAGPVLPPVERPKRLLRRIFSGKRETIPELVEIRAPGRSLTRSEPAHGHLGAAGSPTARCVPGHYSWVYSTQSSVGPPCRRFTGLAHSTRSWIYHQSGTERSLL